MRRGALPRLEIWPFVDLPLPDVAALRDRAVADAQTEVTRDLARFSETTVIGQVLVGNAAASIVQYANDHAADLIVMGTHGRKGIAHFLLGSVAERVIREAPCPVFTVRDVEALRCATSDVAVAATS